MLASTMLMGNGGAVEVLVTGILLKVGFICILRFEDK